MTNLINLTPNRDGSIPPEQLADLPEEVRERLSSPEFAENVKASRKTGRRELHRDPIGFTAAPTPAERVLLRLEKRLMLISNS